MRKLPMDSWFWLPKLGSGFGEIKDSGVLYDSKLGFKITSETDLPRALSVLSRVLSDQVQLVALCFVCGEPLGEDLGSVMCGGCAGSDDAYALYTMKFASLMDQL